MDEIEKFFYGILKTIHISWDPDKDILPTGPDHTVPQNEGYEAQFCFIHQKSDNRKNLDFLRYCECHGIHIKGLEYYQFQFYYYFFTKFAYFWTQFYLAFFN